MNDLTVSIHINREGGAAVFRIPYEEGMNALSALQRIYEEYDHSIAYPICLCRVGRCDACAMRVNGKNVLGCSARLEAGETYLFEPINDEKCIRDLVCT